MALNEQRSVSQVVFNFLPEQVADLSGRVWKVARWRDPFHLKMDDSVVRRELKRVVRPWDGNDDGLAAQLDLGIEIDIVTPSDEGIEVVPFPRLFRCRVCGQIENEDSGMCLKKDHRAWASFPFVAYHHCGKLREPFVPRCPQHNLVASHQVSSRNARDLKFYCPKCNVTISQGIPFMKCDCTLSGTYAIAPPRAGTVYSGHSAIIINPPTAEVAAQFSGNAAKTAALDWVLHGQIEKSPLERRGTLEAMIEYFERQMGIPREAAESMARVAAAQSGGKVTTSETKIDLEGDSRAEAIDGALKLTFATAGGRLTVQDLVERGESSLRERYEANYPNALRVARLESVRLLEKFPVLTGFYGYTRGDRRDAQKNPRLNWFRERSRLRLYSLRAETEALLFTLDPVLVVQWLRTRGFIKAAPTEQREARMLILKGADIPGPGTDVNVPSLGSSVLDLVHSYSHRVIRTISAFCGIDRDALAEYLIPHHLAFIVYANARGDFVLGGLQALFENDLDRALLDIVQGERRCALDPGCSAAGGACMACLHVGEASCRHFNRQLTRAVLFGSSGFFVGSDVVLSA